MGATGRSGTQQPAQSKAEGQEKTQRRTCLQNQLHKTKLCMYHVRGACQYGSDCAFAHSYSELQVTPDLRKTRLCTVFMEGGGCNNPKCPFAHGEDELRSTDMFYKKTLCIWNEKGKCRNGDQCRFAHGAADLRANNAQVMAQEHHLAPAATPGGSRPAGRGGRKAAGAKRAPPQPQPHPPQSGGDKAYPAEPMKIHPTRSLLNGPAPVLSMQGLLHSGMGVPLPVAHEAGMVEQQHQPPNDLMKLEIERLRDVLSALTMKCSNLQQNLYGRDVTGGAGSEDDAGHVFHPAWSTNPPGLDFEDWRAFEQHGMGC